jgi:hypothetical protein
MYEQIDIVSKPHPDGTLPIFHVHQNSTSVPEEAHLESQINSNAEPLPENSSIALDQVILLLSLRREIAS